MMRNTLARIDTESETIPELARRVQAEYAETPGLSVTLVQAQRLRQSMRRRVPPSSER